MKILVADDDAASRALLVGLLSRWGYETAATGDGAEAWRLLQAEDGPRLAILDWMMPSLDGPTICRQARAHEETASVHLILVTARDRAEDVVAGLDSGANDYITKPFNPAELRARVAVGQRILELQQSLTARVRELEHALAHVQQLQGILPICCYCKKVRNDNRFWQQVEDYLAEHSGRDLSHGICPDCWRTVVQPQMQEMWGESPPYEDTP